MNLVPNDEYADVMTAQDWQDYVEDGCFIPYDGTGYWGTADEHSYEHDAFGPKPEWATHVSWYNR